MTDITDRSDPKWYRRAARRVSTLLWTGATLALAGGAIALGSDWVATRAASADIPVAADPVPVSVQPLGREDGYTVTRRFLGQVEPAQTADLSFELAGRVMAIAVDEGDSVAAGALIASLDTALLDTEREQLEASRRALEAQLTFAEQSLARRTALRDRGFSPDEALDQARSDRDALRARLGETEAALASVRVRLEKSELRAPFAGRIGARDVDRGATVASGQPVVRLLETARRIVRVGLPLWVDPAAHREAEIELGGAVVRANLSAVRPDIDPVTRTRTVLYTLPDDVEAAYGQTAALTLEQRIESSGFWVPVAALREGAQGVWTVLVVDSDDIVRAAAVEILHADATRAFVRGALENGARLIEAGPHRVTPGQSVRVTGGA